MEEPREIKSIRGTGSAGTDKEFGKFAGWLQNPPEPPELPPFDAGWLEKTPGYVLDEREQSEILMNSTGGSRILQWGALAAILVLALGGSILFPRFFGSPGLQVAEKTGEPTRAMAMFVQGDARVMTPGVAEPAILSSGTVLEEGVRVETGANGRVDLAFSKGSIVRINANSHLVVESLRMNEGGRQVGLTLEQGSVLSVVERLNQKDGYTVATPTAIAGVRGTSFRVETDGKKTEILCHDGRLSVQKRGEKKDHVLNANQGVRITPEAAGQLRNLETRHQDAAETEALRETLKSFDPAVVKATLELVEVKSEADIERLYQRDLETIILKDGRNLRGIVASQMGDRLIIQTAGKQLVIPLEQVKEIYQNQ